MTDTLLMVGFDLMALSTWAAGQLIISKIESRWPGTERR